MISLLKIVQLKTLMLIAFLFISIAFQAQTLSVEIPKHQFGIDTGKSIIVSRVKNIGQYSDLSNFSTVEIKLNEKLLVFNNLPTSLNFTSSYFVTEKSNSKVYTLYFTELPIISIQSMDSIVDEPKKSAKFHYADNRQNISSDIGIELRGGSSLLFPKKTYDLEFWKDHTGEETRDVQFGNLRLDDDWILDGMYNEPLRLRSFMAHKLWLQIHIPYYKSDRPDARAGANVRYTELFLNGNYQGLYALSEQVDRKLLDLKKHQEEMRGELYKGLIWGNTTFTSLPPFDNTNKIWGGFEMRVPSDDEVTDWNKLYQFINFTMNSSDFIFVNQIWSRFNQSNFEDYFIFLNLLRATDNTGKNIYVGKYQKYEPYFYIPWDLDGCFGTTWEGENQFISDDILGNGLTKRVIELNPRNVCSSLGKKWEAYRGDMLSTKALMDTITSAYNYFSDHKLYERESIVFPNYDFSQSSLAYMTTWLDRRLDYLDTYFQDLELKQDTNTYLKNSILFPNPCKDKIQLTAEKTLLNKKYRIYDNKGILVKEGINDGFEISIQNLLNGYYVLQINSELYRFVKE